MIIWGVAGVVCGVGSFAYAELGTMFPASGGDFQYLSRSYGKKMGLLFGWSFIVVLNPIGTAGIAGVLGKYSVDVITYFQTGNSDGSVSGGYRGQKILNGGPLEIGPHHGNLLRRFQGRQPLSRNATSRAMHSTVASTTTAMVAKRFLDGGNGEDDEYRFSEMDVDDLRLYNNVPRRFFWIRDLPQQRQPQQQEGLAQDSPKVEDVPTFLKPPLPYSHSGVVSPPTPGVGPDGKALLSTIHADNMSMKIRLFSIASIVIMGLINIWFKQGGKWASNILAVFKIAGMMILIGIGITQAIKTKNQSETFKIPIGQCSHNILDYISALCFAFFAVRYFGMSFSFLNCLDYLLSLMQSNQRFGMF